MATALVLIFALMGPLPSVNAATKKPVTKKTQVSKAATKKAAAKQARITLGDLRRTKAERARIRAEARRTAKQVNALKASQSTVIRRLKSLNSTVRVTSVALDKAQRASASATTEAKRARQREKELTARLSTLASSSYRAALSAVASPDVASVGAYLSSGSADDADRQRIVDTLGKRRTADVLDAMTATQQDLGIERALADRAEKRARGYQSAVTDRLGQYRVARSKQQKFADEVENRLEETLAEAASVASIDSGLAARYQRQSEALSRQLRASGAGAGGRGSGSFAIPSDIGASGGNDTHGISVAPSIRGNVARMLAAAKADGLYMTGGGYRSSAGQIALRAAHCGSSSFAIYQARASSCRPPTARPGFSQHERGLAIDFAENGRSLNRGSAGYRWLRGNAARFGFFNLPSEPWHWSTTGR